MAHWLTSQITRLTDSSSEIQERAIHAVCTRVRSSVFTADELMSRIGELGVALSFHLAGGGGSVASNGEAVEILSTLASIPGGARLLSQAEVPLTLRRYLLSPQARDPTFSTVAAAASSLLATVSATTPHATEAQWGAATSTRPPRAHDDSNPWSGSGADLFQSARLKAVASELTASFQGLTRAGVALLQEEEEEGEGMERRTVRGAASVGAGVRPQGCVWERGVGGGGVGEEAHLPTCTFTPFSFPLVALTQSDEEALGGIISGLVPGALPGVGGGWGGDALLALQHLTRVILPHLPAEVLLSCPALLDVLVEGLALPPPVNDHGEGCHDPLFVALVEALMGVFEGLKASLALRLEPGMGVEEVAEGGEHPTTHTSTTTTTTTTAAKKAMPYSTAHTPPLAASMRTLSQPLSSTSSGSLPRYSGSRGGDGGEWSLPPHASSASVTLARAYSRTMPSPFNSTASQGYPASMASLPTTPLPVFAARVLEAGLSACRWEGRRREMGGLLRIASHFALDWHLWGMGGGDGGGQEQHQQLQHPLSFTPLAAETLQRLLDTFALLLMDLTAQYGGDLPHSPLLSSTTVKPPTTLRESLCGPPTSAGIGGGGREEEKDAAASLALLYAHLASQLPPETGELVGVFHALLSSAPASPSPSSTHPLPLPLPSSSTTSTSHLSHCEHLKLWRASHAKSSATVHTPFSLVCFAAGHWGYHASVLEGGESGGVEEGEGEESQGKEEGVEEVLASPSPASHHIPPHLTAAIRLGLRVGCDGALLESVSPLMPTGTLVPIVRAFGGGKGRKVAQRLSSLLNFMSGEGATSLSSSLASSALYTIQHSTAVTNANSSSAAASPPSSPLDSLQGEALACAQALSSLLPLHPLPAVRAAWYSSYCTSLATPSPKGHNPPPTSLLSITTLCGLVDSVPSVAEAAGRVLGVVLSSSPHPPHHHHHLTSAPLPKDLPSLLMASQWLSKGNSSSSSSSGGVGVAHAPANSATTTTATSISSQVWAQLGMGEEEVRLRSLFSGDARVRAEAAAYVRGMVAKWRVDTCVSRALESVGEVALEEGITAATVVAARKARAHSMGTMAVASTFRGVSSDYLHDPLAALTALYPTLGDLPLYPCTSASPLQASCAFLSSLSPSLFSPPTPLLDPSPPTLQALLARPTSSLPHAITTAFNYTGGVALGGSLLGQLEGVLMEGASPSTRTSAALQLAQLFYSSTPLPPHLGARLAEVTLPVFLGVLGATWGVEGCGEGREALGEEGRTRAALLLALEALVSASPQARTLMRASPSALTCMADALLLGPLLPPPQGRTGAHWCLDARLCAARILSKCLWEGEGGGAVQGGGMVTFHPDTSTSFTAATTTTTTSTISSPPRHPPSLVPVHSLVLHACPLLTHPSLACGPSILLPVLCLNTFALDTFSARAPTPLSLTAWEWVKGRATSAVSPAALLTKRAECIAASISSAPNHAALGDALATAISSARASPALAAALLVSHNSNARHGRSLRGGGTNGGGGSVGPLLASLARFIYTPPSTPEDCAVLAGVARLLGAAFTSSLIHYHTSSQGMCSPPKVLTDTLCRAVLLRLIPLLALSEGERDAGNSAIAVHLDHQRPGAGTTFQFGEALGRAELLVDALRGSWLEGEEGGRSSSTFPPHRLEVLVEVLHLVTALVTPPPWECDAAAATAGGVHTEGLWGGESVWGKCALALVREGQRGEFGEEVKAEVEAEGGGGGHLLPFLLPSILHLLHHPHSPSHLRFSSVTLIRTLLSFAPVQCALASLPSSPVLPECAPPPSSTSFPLLTAVKALVRLVSGSRGGDAFLQNSHKGLLREALRGLAAISRGCSEWYPAAPSTTTSATAAFTTPLSQTAPRYSAFALCGVHWVEGGVGGLGWLSRCAVDREAWVRTWAHTIAGALAGAPEGHAFLSMDPHISLTTFMVPTWLRHATRTVSLGASSSSSSSSGGDESSSRMVMSMSGGMGASTSLSHSDVVGAEVPLVRAACAWALGAFLRGASARRGVEGGDATASACLMAAVTAQLLALDAPHRLRQGLLALTLSHQYYAHHSPHPHPSPPFHAPHLLFAITAAGSLDPDYLVTLFASPQCRDALLSLLTHTTTSTRDELGGMMGVLALTATSNPLPSPPSSRRGSRVGLLQPLAEFQAREVWWPCVSSARSNAYTLLRDYLALASTASRPIALPLRLRRFHLQPALPHALHTIALGGAGAGAPGQTITPTPSEVTSALSFLTAALNAWCLCESERKCEEEGSGGNGGKALPASHPLLDFLSPPTHSPKGDERPAGDSPSRIGYSSSPSSSLSSITATHIHTLVPTLAALLSHLDHHPLSVKVAAAVAAGSLAASLSLLPPSSTSKSSASVFGWDAGGAEALSRGMSRLFLEFGEGVMEEEEDGGEGGDQGGGEEEREEEEGGGGLNPEGGRAESGRSILHGLEPKGGSSSSSVTPSLSAPPSTVTAKGSRVTFNHRAGPTTTTTNLGRSGGVSRRTLPSVGGGYPPPRTAPPLHSHHSHPLNATTTTSFSAATTTSTRLYFPPLPSSSPSHTHPHSSTPAPTRKAIAQECSRAVLALRACGLSAAFLNDYPQAAGGVSSPVPGLLSGLEDAVRMVWGEHHEGAGEKEEEVEEEAEPYFHVGAIEAYTRCVRGVQCVRDDLATALAAVLECTHLVYSSSGSGSGGGAWVGSPVGALCAQDWGLERGFGPPPLYTMTRQVDGVAHTLMTLVGGFVSGALPPLAVIIALIPALGEGLALLKVKAAVFYPHPHPTGATTTTTSSTHAAAAAAHHHSPRSPRSSILGAATEAALPTVLTSALAASASLLHLAPKLLPPHGLLQCSTLAIQLACATCAVGINLSAGVEGAEGGGLLTLFSGSPAAVQAAAFRRHKQVGERGGVTSPISKRGAGGGGKGGGGGGGSLAGAGAAPLPHSHPSSTHSFIDVVLGELLQASEAILGADPSSSSSATPHHTPAYSAAGKVGAVGVVSAVLTHPYRTAFTPGGAAAAIARVHEALSTLVMAAARRSGGVRAVLLTRALPSALAVPLHRKLAWAKSSATAISHLPLGAMAAQFKVLAALACPGDSEACGGVCKGEKVFEAAALALALPRSPSHPPHVSTAINDLRVAAATLLANLATRKGSDSAWSARPALLTQCFGALRDECVGVRAATAACIAALVRNSVRLRVTPGIGEAVRGALSDNTALLASAKGRGVAHLAAHFNTLRGDPPTAAHPLSVEEAAEEVRQVKNAAGILETAVRCCEEALSSLLHHG